MVLALVAVVESTSAKWFTLLASNLKALNPSVIISLTLANFSPLALAAAKIPAVPSRMSFVFQPAKAIYCIASFT